MKIRIDVPVYNRKDITEIVLTQLQKTKDPSDVLRIYNDNSTEYDDNFLKAFGEVKNYDVKCEHRWQNIHKIRSLAFRDFLLEDFDFLYMTDNDALHDPNWRNELLQGYEETKLPMSGYISGYMYNNFDYYKRQFTNSRFMPIHSTGGGISILLHKSHVRTIVDRMGVSDMQDMWDCTTWGYLNNRYALTRQSFLDHFGKGGLHHQTWDQERAINPTSYLINIRQSMIDYLENKIGKDGILQKV